MLTNHAITSTSAGTWLYPMLLLLLLSLSLSYSPSIEAFGVTSTTNGNVASKTISHTQSQIAAYCATRCIDKYNGRFKNSGGHHRSFRTTTTTTTTSTTFGCGCGGSSFSHSSLTLSLSRPTAVEGASSLLLVNSMTTAIDDDSSSTVNDDNKDNNNNNNNESCANNHNYHNPIIDTSGITKSKTNASIGTYNVGRSAATTGLVISIVLGGLNYGASAAIAAPSTSEEIKELKQLIIEKSNKMDERFNNFDKNYIYFPTFTVLGSAFINQYMTAKSIRATEKAFGEKVDRTAASFRISANVNGGLSVAVIVVFVMIISLYGKHG